MKTYKRFLAVNACNMICLVMFCLSNAAIADVEKDLQTCYDCHGKDGASTEPEIPIIGGYSATYIIDSMIAYQNEERPCQKTEIPDGPRKGEKEDMCAIAKNLSEADTEAMAEHLASEPFVRAKQTFDPEKAKLGKKVQNRQCAKCHEDGGSSPDDDAGILAGQWMPYMNQQMKEYTSGKRPMTKKMAKKFKKLNDADKENIVHYYGSFQ